MFYIDLTSFAVGVLTGVVGAAIFVGFAALLVVHHGSQSVKRDLEGRHSAGGLQHGQLSGAPFSVTAFSAPQKDSAEPGSSTVAGRVPPSRPPRRKRPRTPSLLTLSRSQLLRGPHEH